MKVRHLIALLQEMPEDADVLAETIRYETGQPELFAIERVATAESPVYGTAVVIELED